VPINDATSEYLVGILPGEQDPEVLSSILSCLATAPASIRTRIYDAVSMISVKNGDIDYSSLAYIQHTDESLLHFMMRQLTTLESGAGRESMYAAIASRAGLSEDRRLQTDVGSELVRRYFEEPTQHARTAILEAVESLRDRRLITNTLDSIYAQEPSASLRLAIVISLLKHADSSNRSSTLQTAMTTDPSPEVRAFLSQSRR
jgi:hypothetical protein